YEDYSVKEISDILGVKETTIQTRLMRARKMLKQQLEEAWK
ncbi:MAG: RNA polymerase subunit sigma, partial [Lachnospiraceae bacterium]|nr:RNA polymerase subunit sigma [Lachnospiraceae bacterium]